VTRYVGSALPLFGLSGKTRSGALQPFFSCHAFGFFFSSFRLSFPPRAPQLLFQAHDVPSPFARSDTLNPGFPYYFTHRPKAIFFKIFLPARVPQDQGYLYLLFLSAVGVFFFGASLFCALGSGRFWTCQSLGFLGFVICAPKLVTAVFFSAEPLDPLPLSRVSILCAPGDSFLTSRCPKPFLCVISAWPIPVSESPRTRAPNSFPCP